jgi:hypothetical protein
VERRKSVPGRFSAEPVPQSLLTELIVRDETHPLFVKDVFTRNVRGDVSTDRVSNVLGTVRVELTTSVTVRDVDLGSVPESVDLDVSGGLDELYRSGGQC